MQAKSLEIGKRTATIKLSGEYDNYHEIPRLKTEALYVLAGGYNQLGRKVDIARYEQIKRRFDQTISDMAYELKAV